MLIEKGGDGGRLWSIGADGRSGRERREPGRQPATYCRMRQSPGRSYPQVIHNLLLLTIDNSYPQLIAFNYING